MRFGLILIALVVSAASFGSDRYPSTWWEPVDRETAPDWEILPQDAERGEVILSKRNELGILSNFAETAFRFDRVRYNSLEGFWQMMKFPEDSSDPRFDERVSWSFTRRDVSQMVGFNAKRAGKEGSLNMETLGINWVSYRGKQMTYRTSDKGEHYRLIKRAMWAKLRQNREVRNILKRTGDLILRPDHRQDNPPPAWQYHKIWMEIRSRLR